MAKQKNTYILTYGDFKAGDVIESVCRNMGYDDAKVNVCCEPRDKCSWVHAVVHDGKPIGYLFQKRGLELVLGLFHELLNIVRWRIPNHLERLVGSIYFKAVYKIEPDYLVEKPEGYLDCRPVSLQILGRANQAEFIDDVLYNVQSEIMGDRIIDFGVVLKRIIEEVKEQGQVE